MPRAYVQPKAIIKSLQYMDPNDQILENTKNLTNEDSPLQKFNPQGGNYHVILPDPVDCNGMLFYIMNSFESNGIVQIYNHTNTHLISAISSGNIAFLICISDNWESYSFGIDDNNIKTEAVSRIIDIDNTMSSTEIQNKIDDIGKHILSNVSIVVQFADGVYDLTEEIHIDGFFGGGELHIVGNLSETGAGINKSVVLDGANIPSHYGWSNLIRCNTNAISIYIKAIKFIVYSSSNGGTTDLQLGLVVTRQFPVCVLRGLYFEGYTQVDEIGVELSDGQYKMIDTLFSKLTYGTIVNRGSIARILNCGDVGVKPNTGLYSDKAIIYYDISVRKIEGSITDTQSSYGTIYTS